MLMTLLQTSLCVGLWKDYPPQFDNCGKIASEGNPKFEARNSKQIGILTTKIMKKKTKK